MTAKLIDFNKALEDRVSGIPLPEVVTELVPSQKTTPAITIAVIDNVALSRSCIVHALRYNNQVISEFTTASEVSGNFNIIILYHHDGSEAVTLLDLQLLQERGFIVLIGDGLSTDTVREALELGIKAYVPAVSIDLDHIRNILKFVLEGGVYIPPSILGRKSKDGPPFGVTEREMLILRLMHLGKQNKVIAYELGLSESTVKVHIRHILTKFSARNRTEAVSFAIKKGLVS